MRLKLSFMILLVLTINCCLSSKNINDEIAVIGTIYNRIPKIIPPFPDSSNTSDTQKKTKEPLIHRYAIYNQYIVLDPSIDINNIFNDIQSNELFAKVKISAEEMFLVGQLKKLEGEDYINEKSMIEYVNEELLFLDQQFIDDTYKKNYNINRILSFSRVSLNKSNKKAAIAVGNYGGSLDSSFTIYILEKEDRIWKVLYSKTIEIS